MDVDSVLSEGDALKCTIRCLFLFAQLALKWEPKRESK